MIKTFDELVDVIETPEKHFSEVSDGVFNSSELVDKVNELRETYAKPVEMTKEQSDTLKRMKKYGKEFLNTVADAELPAMIDGVPWVNRNWLFHDLNEEDLMHAWLHPELIKVLH